MFPFLKTLYPGGIRTHGLPIYDAILSAHQVPTDQDDEIM
jgi:hypothetical protein